MNIFKTRPLLTPWEDFNVLTAAIFGFKSTIHNRKCFFNQMDMLCTIPVLSHIAFKLANPYSQSSPVNGLPPSYNFPSNVRRIPAPS